LEDFFPDEVVCAVLVDEEVLWGLVELAVEEAFLLESPELCRGVAAARTQVIVTAQIADNARSRIMVWLPI